MPESVNLSPHAPWWSFDPGTGRTSVEATWANPNAEVVGWLCRYGDAAGVDRSLRDEGTALALRHLAEREAPLDLHDFLCYARLADALPGPVREAVLGRLTADVGRVVERDPDMWRTYGARPLTLAPTPSSPFASALAEAIAANLDFALESQAADGGWPPTWSWADADPVAWAEAEREWSGALTVATLASLKAFGRIAGDR